MKEACINSESLPLNDLRVKETAQCSAGYDFASALVKTKPLCPPPSVLIMTVRSSHLFQLQVLVSASATAVRSF